MIKTEKNIADIIAQYNAVISDNTLLKTALTTADNKISNLEEQLAWYKRQIFGKKSERITEIPGEMHELELPGLDLTQLKKEVGEKVHIKSHTRAQNITNKGNCKLEVDDSIEVVEKIIDIPEEDKIDKNTGEQLVCIGYDVSEKLATNPEQHYILRTLRPKYTLKSDSLYGIYQAKAEDCILDGSKFDASFMSYAACEKFCYHMPLYRIAEKLNNTGVKVTRQTLGGLLINLGEKVQPLIDLIKLELFKHGYLYSDDTHVNLLADRNTKSKQSRIWIYASNTPGLPEYQLYQFSKDRTQKHPIDFLKKFKGVLHADAYKAYVNIDKDRKDINWAACWAHGRRKFENAQTSLEFRHTVLRLIRYLFLFERVGWNRTEEERLKIRNKYELPIVDRIFDMLKKKVGDNTLLPKSKIAEAIGYMLSKEKNFRYYLSDANARMDNNTAERALRKIVIGRKNWMFLGSPRSGKAMANLMTLIQTCRIMKINPYTYLDDVFRNFLKHPSKNMSDYLPDQWKKIRN